MSEEAGRDELKFKIICVWCGGIIRRTNARDSRGMCLQCYSRMLREHHTRAEGSEQRPRWASDR